MQYLSVGVTREDVERLPGTAPAALIAPELHGLLYDVAGAERSQRPAVDGAYRRSR